MNQVCLIGRLTRDIELRTAQSGTTVGRFTLAVDNRDDTAFIPCVAFGKTAETISNWCPKGRQIGVTGRLETGSYEKDGQRIYTWDVSVSQMYFCGNKSDNSAPAQQRPKPVSESEPPQGFTEYDEDDEEEIPF